MPEKRLSSASGATSAGGKKQSGPNAKAETPAALAEGDQELWSHLQAAMETLRARGLGLEPGTLPTVDSPKTILQY